MMVGCQSGLVPDPNDAKDGPLTPEIISKQLEALNIGLFNRWQKGEFDEKTYKSWLKKGADEILSAAKAESMDPSDIWMYGDVLRTAEKWPEAEKALQIAVKHAKSVKNEDRRINDTLRLAQVRAKLGKVDLALQDVRETFNASPRDAVPILMATLYEIAPAARGKGKDRELAQVLEAAMVTCQKAEVDPKTESGQAFLAARPAHLRKALNLVVDLYRDTGDLDVARAAIRRVLESSSGASRSASR